MEFKSFPKLYRLSREVIITEKIDGTNAQIVITEDGHFMTGSRNRWITPEDDNYGFAKWANENKEDLLTLGHGQHFGEWYGSGIQRNYGLKEKKFVLFNSTRWNKSDRPKCCQVVPELYRGIFDEDKIKYALLNLQHFGSALVPGFMKPEGVVIYHTASGVGFKKTIEKDEMPKTYGFNTPRSE